jgi:hypothetical protein
LDSNFLLANLYARRRNALCGNREADIRGFRLLWFNYLPTVLCIGLKRKCIFQFSRKCENENFHFNPSFMHDTDPPLEKNVRNHTQGKFKQQVKFI